jgi:hypothetical protein
MRFFCCSSRSSTRSRTTCEVPSVLREILLAVGAARFGGRRVAARGCCRGSTASTASLAAASAALSTTTTAACRRGSGRRGAAYIGELFEEAVIQRHQEEVSAARESDALAVLCKARIGLGLAGLGELGDLPVVLFRV